MRHHSMTPAMILCKKGQALPRGLILYAIGERAAGFRRRMDRRDIETGARGKADQQTFEWG